MPTDVCVQNFMAKKIIFSFQEMLVYFSSTHRWASLVVPPVGFVLNTVLLYLICRRTPAEMRVNSRILVQTCLFDCLYLAFMLIGGMPVKNSAFILMSFTSFDYYLMVLTSLNHRCQCLTGQAHPSTSSGDTSSSNLRGALAQKACNTISTSSTPFTILAFLVFVSNSSTAIYV
jgi:hypothetical protein